MHASTTDPADARSLGTPTPFRAAARLAASTVLLGAPLAVPAHGLHETIHGLAHVVLFHATGAAGLVVLAAAAVAGLVALGARAARAARAHERAAPSRRQQP